MNCTWMRFLLKRYRLKALAAIREKERAKAKIYDIIYDTVRWLEMQATLDDEKKSVLEYLKTFKYTGANFPVFPNHFADKYKEKDIEVYTDNNNNFLYVLHNGKKMYMKKDMEKDQVISYMRELCKEQDLASTHRYIYSESEVLGKYIADMGGAEGFFALDVIEKAKKVYIFECDPGWLEALHLTFAPYKDKVDIVPKYIDEKTKDDSVSVDDYFADKELDFIKADIEGYEVPMLRGAKKTIGKIETLLLCAYHKHDDERYITSILEQAGFNVTTSSGYMLFVYDDSLKVPYLRRGLVRGERKK